MAPKDVRVDVRAEIAVRRERQLGVRFDDQRDGAACCPTRFARGSSSPQSGGGVGGWVDAAGTASSRRTQLGFRAASGCPYEVAFENWSASDAIGAPRRACAADRDVLETTAIAANKRLPRVASASCACGSAAWTSSGFDLDGGRQQLRGRHAHRCRARRRQRSLARDVSSCRYGGRDSSTTLKPSRSSRSNHPEIVRAGARDCAAASRDPRVVAAADQPVGARLDARRRSPSASRARCRCCTRGAATATSTRSSSSRWRAPRAFRRASRPGSRTWTASSTTTPGRKCCCADWVAVDPDLRPVPRRRRAPALRRRRTRAAGRAAATHGQPEDRRARDEPRREMIKLTQSHEEVRRLHRRRRRSISRCRRASCSAFSARTAPARRRRCA